MAKSLCLSLGEFFAEVSLQDLGSKEKPKSARWPLFKASLEKGLQAFLADFEAAEITHIQVNLPVLESLLRRRLGNPPAFLTTEGFENWLEMNLPVEPNHLSLKPKRVRSPLDSDLIFGVSERVSAEGKILKPMDEAEIEFLCSKLELNEVKWVALGLLHADKNPEHEQKMAEILSNKGFKVVTSSSFQSDSERPRWWAAVLTAYLAPLIEDRIADLKKIFEALGVTTQPLFWTGSGLKAEWPLADSLNLLFGSSHIVQNWLKKNSLTGGLFLDVEGFYFQDSVKREASNWISELGPVAYPVTTWTKLKLQPTSSLEASWLGGLDLGDNEVGYEPGPISLGRGLIPCYMDALNYLDSEEEVPGLSDQIQDRAKTRVAEAISTLVKSFSKEAWRDINDMTADVCDLGVRQIVWDHLLPLGNDIVFMGGMSPVIFKRLKRLPSMPIKTSCKPSLLSELALGGQSH